MSSYTIHDLLRADHAAIEELAARIDHTGEVPTKRELFAWLKALLESHFEAEDDVYYAALRQHPETESIARLGSEEIERVKNLLRELGSTPAEQDAWTQKFSDLRQVLEQHVALEENARFEEVRRTLAEDDVKEMTRAFETRRKGSAAAGA